MVVVCVTSNVPASRLINLHSSPSISPHASPYSKQGYTELADGPQTPLRATCEPLEVCEYLNLFTHDSRGFYALNDVVVQYSPLNRTLARRRHNAMDKIDSRRG